MEKSQGFGLGSSGSAVTTPQNSFRTSHKYIWWTVLGPSMALRLLWLLPRPGWASTDNTQSSAWNSHTGANHSRVGSGGVGLVNGQFPPPRGEKLYMVKPFPEGPTLLSKIEKDFPDVLKLIWERSLIESKKNTILFLVCVCVWMHYLLLNPDIDVILDMPQFVPNTPVFIPIVWKHNLSDSVRLFKNAEQAFLFLFYHSYFLLFIFFLFFIEHWILLILFYFIFTYLFYYCCIGGTLWHLKLPQYIIVEFNLVFVSF
jgi:hypothetical protein